MNKLKLSLLGAMTALSFSYTAFALNPPTRFADDGSNEFIFIENSVDSEYFIAADTLSPRFTGASVWTKYGKDNQRSLGYMGSGRSIGSRNNVDMWLENSGMLRPFDGIRCQSSGSLCPSTGFLPAAYKDDYGFYKAVSGNSTTNGNDSYGSFDLGGYEFLRDMSVNSLENFIMHTCYTSEDYDPTKGERCKDATRGTWEKAQYNITKTGHLKLFDNRAFSEIWVATDGTPSLTSSNDACEYIVIGNSSGTVAQRRNEGIACKMVRYHLEGQPSAFNSRTYLYMVIDNTALNNMTLDARDIKINAGGSTTWANWSADTGSDNRMNTQMVSGDGYIRVLFTKQFFMNMMNAGASTSGKKGIFTFAVNNDRLPQSGYYQFATNMEIDIIPREYGISIRHKNVNEQVKTGKIGKEEQDITFDYVVTQSAPRKADTVKASVIGNSTKVRSNSYCLFTSSDSKLNVAIPAYLAFTHENGGRVEEYSGCDENATLDLTKAQWSATPWDEQQSGYFYSTDLKLRFPMNDSVSLFTTDGIDWLGTVRAEGDVKVEATWIGVNR